MDTAPDTEAPDTAADTKAWTVQLALTGGRRRMTGQEDSIF